MPRTSATPKKKASSAGKPKGGTSKPSAQEIRRMIEVAAYYKAERRNFAPGFEDLDWLEAEKEISRIVGKKVTAKRK